MPMVSTSVKRYGTLLCLCVPILFACFFASTRQQADIDIFDDVESDALGLIQRKAEVIVSKKYSEAELSEFALGVAKSTTTVSTTTSGSATEVSANGVGNTKTFFVGLITDFTVIGLCLVIFWWFKRQYPIMMRGNEMEGWAPKGAHIPSHEGFFGWMRASWAVTFEDVWQSAGLDQAQLLEYVNMNMRLFKYIGLPFFFIIGPLNCFFGGNAAGADHLSWFSMGNVRYGQPWLYYVYALCIWYIVVLSTKLIHDEMRAFIPRRIIWLKEMAEIRANTIRMEGIPEKYQSDQACLAFWNTIMPGNKVKELHLAKDTLTCGLQADYNLKNEAEKKLMQAEAEWAAKGKTPESKPMYKPSTFGSKVEAIPYWQDVITDCISKIAVERKRIIAEAKDLGGVNMGNGFVTFNTRADAEVALRLDLSADSDEWVLEYAPEPKDVLWADMTQDPTAEGGRLITGYLLTLVIVITYLPLVVGITNIATEINLGPLQSLWASEAPSLGLTIMVDFLPTFLMIIFTNFFSLWDTTASQLQLSRWFFWMQVLYIILIAALGTSFIKFVETLATDPLKIFELLSSTMPNCTHYYMNYLCMQWYSQAMVLTRYMPVSKFRMFTAGGAHEDEEAKAMAEPEDQDYYGMGSRSGRWATFVGIGLVFGTLSPPIDLLVWATMFILRTIYGWNFCFSETKKSDTGGCFFVQALGYSYISLHIYMILMLGVLYYRAPNVVPAVIAFFAWIYVFASQRKFFHYSWQRLPFPELTSAATTKVTHKIRELKGGFEQPELHD